MLILTRRPGESIFLGENAEIRLHVLEAKGKQVKLGIEAPKEVSIYRNEIYPFNNNINANVP